MKTKKEYFRELGLRFKHFDNRVKFKQQIGAIHRRIWNDYKVNKLPLKDFNEVNQILKKYKRL